MSYNGVPPVVRCNVVGVASLSPTPSYHCCATHVKYAYALSIRPYLNRHRNPGLDGFNVWVDGVTLGRGKRLHYNNSI